MLLSAEEYAHLPAARRIRTVYIVNTGEPLLQAVHEMCKRNVSCVVAVEQRAGRVRPVGIVTDRDIVRELALDEDESITAGDSGVHSCRRTRAGHRATILIWDLLSRIRWDTEFGNTECVIGYWDRVGRRLIRVPFRRIRFDEHAR